MQKLRRKHLIDVPWKNGGGITRNIATGMRGDALAWRISRADVDVEGPFSNFEGLTRILTVVSNHSMELRHDDGILHAHSWTPLKFDGGLEVVSHLPDGPLTDLNLMFDPTLCRAHAKVSRGPDQIAPPTDQSICVLHVLQGTPQSEAQGFGVGDSLFLTSSDQAPVVLDQGDAVLEILIQPLDQSADIRLCIAER